MDGDNTSGTDACYIRRHEAKAQVDQLCQKPGVLREAVRRRVRRQAYSVYTPDTQAPTEPAIKGCRGLSLVAGLSHYDLGGFELSVPILLVVHSDEGAFREL